MLKILYEIAIFRLTSICPRQMMLVQNLLCLINASLFGEYIHLIEQKLFNFLV